MAKAPYAPKLDTSRDIQKAVEDIWADLMNAKHAVHFLLHELEEDWSSAVDRKDDPNVIEDKSARTWLVSTIWDAVRDADERLCYLINEIPEEVKPNA